MLELVLVRHGVTVWNQDRILQGHQNVPLSSEGILQSLRLATALSRRARPERIVSSDLQRAVETARPMVDACGLQLETTAELRERCFGIYEGQRWEEVAEQLKIQAQRQGVEPLRYAPPGGESRLQVMERLKRFIASLPVEASAPIWIVTHGGVIRTLLGMLVGDSIPELKSGYAIPNASITTLRLERDRWTLVSLLDTTHLDESPAVSKPGEETL